MSYNDLVRYIWSNCSASCVYVDPNNIPAITLINLIILITDIAHVIFILMITLITHINRHIDSTGAYDSGW